MPPAEGEYAASERVSVAETPHLRVRRLSLAPGEHVPWHRHTHISDTFFCMEGPMEVQAKDPSELRRLEPGGTWAVEPGRPHFVRGADGGGCRFLVVQGVGPCDYVPLGDEPRWYGTRFPATTLQASGSDLRSRLPARWWRGTWFRTTATAQSSA